MADSNYEKRTRQQIAADTAKEKGLFGTISTYLSGDMPKTDRKDDPQGVVNRANKNKRVRLKNIQQKKSELAQRKKDESNRAKKREIDKLQKVANTNIKNLQKELRDKQAKLDSSSALVSGRPLNAEKIMDMRNKK